MTDIPRVVTLWLDPVCPFSWNTARWLMAAADKIGFEIDWRLMSLAVLNDDRDMPAPLQQRMRDSKKMGQVMVALRDQLGVDAMARAYVAFGERYFDQGAALDDELITEIAPSIGLAAVTDGSLDAAVRQSHDASQKALGDVGGSPLITIDGRTLFGPVLTAVPEPDQTTAVFDAVLTLARTDEFSQLQRPRHH
ncbi:mycothiol-dependent nitroreductase Rv2466c family protein [Mycobacterium paraterrae]|uniref:DsbA family protein n=1 Tax=Mycobacterium paraterrae TaxID=577492 RepID=A0ABY3VHJ7_9MYCO|nr:DsbA family protein [Mycobacterium paraterrae]UMB68796.1 DsbA family protein [Mycobacterium paraterrae]